MSTSTLATISPPTTTAPVLPRQAPPRRRSYPGSSARADRTAEALRRAATCSEAERQVLLDEVVTLNLGVATSIAARYRTRGIAADDLRQVACLALVKAAHGYDATVGHDFLSYAVPTIRGEIKRHFRDQGWMIRPPRRIQELQARISAAEAELTQSLGRSPRPSEIARHLGEPSEDVNEALATAGCFIPSSLDRPAGADTSTPVGDLLGDEDAGQGAAEARVLLAPAVRRLGDRDRRILLLRFFHGLTQQEIADEIGVTQMQVSRLLTRIMADLRTVLGDREPAAS
jgi:RNA polymerase sigma-B factor